MRTLLQTRGLGMTYRSKIEEVEALKDCDFSLIEGEIVAIMGPSGCGKSTLLNLLGLLSRPTSGVLEIEGTLAPSSITQRSRIRNSFFGFLHQDYAILDELNVYQNVCIPLEYAVPRVGRRERHERVEKSLDDVGLPGIQKRRADQLSGGQRQRVALARALVNRPRVILADEPTAALDHHTTDQVLDLLDHVRDDGGAVILATHDPEVAGRCDRIVTMRDGRVNVTVPGAPG